ncbi:MAG TPA: hypothetical protein VEY51_19155 [Chondromyces sp.]|nr:hypothetical protein [Chondromyces sp.]
MVVENLLDSKHYFVGETKENFLVVYEKLQQTDAVFKGDDFEQYEGPTEEYVKIMEGEEEACCLRNIKSYKIGMEYKCLEDALENIKNTHREIFK